MPAKLPATKNIVSLLNDFFSVSLKSQKVVNRAVTKQSNLVIVAETCVLVPFYSLLYLLQNLEIDTDDMGGDWFWGLNRLLKCHPLAHKMWDDEKSLTEVFVSWFMKYDFLERCSVKLLSMFFNVLCIDNNTNCGDNNCEKKL